MNVRPLSLARVSGTALLCASFGLFTMARSASAAESPEVRAELVFRAPKGCPTRADLVGRVHARLPRASFESVNAPTSFLVTIDTETPPDGSPEVFRAEMESARPEGPQRRTLKAPTCAEVVDAIALMIALTLDADRGKAPEEPPPAPVPRPESPGYALFLRLGVGSELGSLPHPALGVFAAVGVEKSRATSVLAPSFALEPSVLTSDLLAETPSKGTYIRFGVRAEGCPLRLPLGTTLSLQPCAFLGAFAVRAEGTTAPIPASQVIFWADAGLSVRARAAFGPAFVELQGGAVVPITRPNYVLESPKIVVYATPAVSGLFTLAGGVRFL